MIRAVSTLLVLCLIQIGCTSNPGQSLPETVDFNLHIKPILSDRCFKCHGPDDNAREAELRLHTEQGAFAALKDQADRFVIVPGKPDESELMKRISSTDRKEMMPPPESNLALSDYEIQLIHKWIKQGAEWKSHWAFIPPEKPEPPTVRPSDWPLNEIDAFVLNRMEAVGLEPAPEASKEKLLRRVSFDLTGLPPTLEEIESFLQDTDPDAYEKVVDRLLASPAYGERMASIWLDVARYADTHGYQDDRPRTMWPWRDWVVKAFNDNLPYDAFVTWQLAGDLLPDATYEQKLATGFNRNHGITQEGGVVPEEYLTEYWADRTNTMSTAFLGLTMECARCHDHKYDPITQREYYQLFSFFNNVDEKAQISYFNLAPEPAMPVQDEALEAQVAHTEAAIADREALLGALAEQPDEVFDTWIRSIDDLRLDQDLTRDLEAYHRMDALAGGRLANEVDPSNPGRINTGLENELAAPVLVSGKLDQALMFDGTNFLNVGDVGDFDWYDRFSFGGWIQPGPTRRNKAAALFSRRNGEQKRGGYTLMLTPQNRLRFRLRHDEDYELIVTTRPSVERDAWTHVFVAYNGSGRADGVSLYINGEAQPVQIEKDQLNRKSTLNGNDFLVGNWTHRKRTRDDIHGFDEGTVDELRIYNRNLSPLEVRQIVGLDPVQRYSRAAPGRQQQLLSSIIQPYYLQSVHVDYQRITTELDSLRRSHQVIPNVMIMQERAEPRQAFVLSRGRYDMPTDSVEPGTPAQILSFPDDYPKNRLGLARWLMHEQNPLTARVIVNRYWQQYFGRGLVRTPEDFGNQGALPSHPLLLDWLATTFMESGWDVKAMQKRIVMSATYRQAAGMSAEQLAIDPDNTYLARGPYRRLSAEMVRDHALAVSGLLVGNIGGVPVRPYQPAGVWKALANQIGENKYRIGRGRELYRRSLYTYWKRTIPPPSMLTFDASERAVCTVYRPTTSTPLQSLVLLNDPQYVEAARAMAEQLLSADIPVEDRLSQTFEHITSRKPAARELQTVAALYTDQLERFRQAPDQAEALLDVGSRPSLPDHDPVTLAALTIVTNTLMNLDEAKFR